MRKYDKNTIGEGSTETPLITFVNVIPVERRRVLLHQILARQTQFLHLKAKRKTKNKTKRQALNAFHKESEHTGNFDDEEYEITGIKAWKLDEMGEILYKVQWKDTTQTNWLSLDKLEGAKETVDEYNDSVTCNKCKHMASTPQLLCNHMKTCEK